jgi:diguanylate cyclase (GGDEF)-like protein/PAS domain S-box-containing protein
MTEDDAKKIAFLERRVEREKSARRASEFILEEKSHELYHANQKLLKAIRDLEILTLAVEQSPIIVLISDVAGVLEYVNQAFIDISGLKKADVIGQSIPSLGLNIKGEVKEGVRLVINEKLTWKSQITGIAPDGFEYQLSISISPVLDNDNKVAHLLYNCQDITKQKQNEQKIYELAHHDSLTGLANRYSIDAILEQAISTAQRNKTQVSVLFVDMDRFKRINDDHGHKFGDALLQQVAHRLQGICRRKSDYLARIGGDEFLVVLTDTKDSTFSSLTAESIIEVLSLPYLIEGQELKSTPSIGISLYPNDGTTTSELISNADAAMYHR